MAEDWKLGSNTLSKTQPFWGLAQSRRLVTRAQPISHALFGEDQFGCWASASIFWRRVRT
jgi:hypothetical protein